MPVGVYEVFRVMGCLMLSSSDLTLGGAVKTVERVVMEKGEEPVCVLVDGFSVLLSIGVTLREAVMFVQKCMHLLTSSQGPCKVRIIDSFIWTSLI